LFGNKKIFSLIKKKATLFFLFYPKRIKVTSLLQKKNFW
jgi:hypothetical protein